MNQQYTSRLEQIETVLAQWLPETSVLAAAEGRAWIDEVFPGLEGKVSPQLLQALIAPAKDLLARGGKRWRPLLMTLVCEALGGGNDALPLVPLIELCHNASLIHDDIEDNSDERRGKAAVHISYGVDMAINSGCFLYFLPLACIQSWSEYLESEAQLPRPLAQACKAYVQTMWGVYMRKLHLGQAMDIHWHRNLELVPSLDEYYTMCKLKTGCLARFAAEMGVAVITTVSADMVSVPVGYLGKAAEKLGVGFQILDDVKNLTIGIPGKKRGDDIIEGKKSLPILMFLHRYPEKKELVFRCISAARSGGVSAPEVEVLIQELHRSGVIAEAESQGKKLIAEAREIFTVPTPGLPLSEEGRGLLAGLIDFIG